MTEAYLIENGEITEPLREGNLIGNGPQVLARHRHARQRLRDGQPGHVRQGRPGRPRRRRPAHAAGEVADRSAAPACMTPESDPWRSTGRAMSGSSASCRRRRPGRRAGPTGRADRGVRRPAAARPRSASTRARSSTSSRPRARASASGSSATVAPASPTPARSTTTPIARGAGRGPRQRAVRHRRRVGRRSPSPTASPVTEQTLWNDDARRVPDRPQDRARQGARDA